MLIRVLRSLVGARDREPVPPDPRALLEAARADIDGLSDAAAIARLSARCAHNEADPAHEYVLGMLHLRTGQAGHARECFAALRTRASPTPFDQHSRLGEALARAQLARARGETVGPRALDAAARATRVSVVICSIRPDRFATVSANFERLLAAVPHEIIGIHDARSLCEGYNRGLRRATGETVVFSHDDIEIVSTDFAAKLHAGLAEADLLGVAGTSRLEAPTWWQAGWPDIHGQVAQTTDKGRWTVTVFGVRDRLVHGIDALDGLLFAARREPAAQIGFDEACFDGWHFYDIDFTFSAKRDGYRLAVANDILVHHASQGRFDNDWKRYAARFAEKHGRYLSPSRGAPAPLANGVLHVFDNPADWVEVSEQLIAIARESRDAELPRRG